MKILNIATLNKVDVNRLIKINTALRITVKRIFMKNIVNKSEITAKTVEGVKSQVEELVSRYNNVVSDKEAAEQFFTDCEIEGDLHSENVQNFSVLGEINGDWQETITVVITAYYKDAGSEDYCYKVSVTED